MVQSDIITRRPSMSILTNNPNKKIKKQELKNGDLSYRNKRLEYKNSYERIFDKRSVSELPIISHKNYVNKNLSKKLH